MGKEVLVHEAVGGFRVIFWQIDIFVHVECYDIGERDLAIFVRLYEVFIYNLWAAAGGQPKHERPLGSRRKRINAVDDMAGSIFRGAVFVVTNNDPHLVRRQSRIEAVAGKKSTHNLPRVHGEGNR